MAHQREMDPSRRRLLQGGGAALMLGTLVGRAGRASAAPAGPSSNATKLPRLLPPTENKPEPPPAPEPPGKRVGFAVVGLGHLALEQILPAFGESHRCRLAALVSGDRNKAAAVAAAHGV